jgi:hypothetical protein
MADRDKSTFKQVRVRDIILSQDHPEFKKFGYFDGIGTIKYGEIETEAGTVNTKELKAARPLFSFLKQYPIVDEIVILIPAVSNKVYTSRGSQDMYYLPVMNIWNHPNHNCLPTFYDYKDTEGVAEDYRQVGAGVIRAPEDGSTNLTFGKYFKEKLNVQPLLPFEGDTIIEGRWGNSIRLSSTSRGAYDKTSYSTDIKGKNTRGDDDKKIEKSSENGDPITIIRNGQLFEEEDRGWEHAIENINQDHSSIYMTSNQVISNFQPVSLHWESWMAKSGDLEVDDGFENLAKGPDIPKVKIIEETKEEEKEKEQQFIEEEDNNDDNQSSEESTDEPLITPSSAQVDDELSIYDEVLEQEDFVEDYVQWIDAEGDTVVTQVWQVDESSQGTIIADESGKDNKKVTSDMISSTPKQGCDRYPAENINLFLSAMDDYANEYPIFANKYMRVGMLSVAAKECSLAPKGEKSYKGTPTKNMRKIFNKTISHLTDNDLNELKSNWDEEKWWDITYGYLGAGNKVNYGSAQIEYSKKYGAGRAAQYGHTEKGDGYRYRGRGMIQLTWKSSYKKYGKIAQKINGWSTNQFLENPDSVNKLPNAIQSAIVYIADHFRYKNGHKFYKRWGVNDPSQVDNYLSALGMMFNAVAGWGHTKGYVDSHDGYLKMQKNYQCFIDYVESNKG